MMNQLETQVSDLRAFLTSDGPATGSPSGAPYSPVPPAPPSRSSPSAGGDNSARLPYAPSPGKRKSETGDDDAGGKQQKSKRNRYISIACNECKRRKIKCNGQTPCQRCGHLNLQCLYAPNCCSNSLKDSDEFRSMSEHVAHLQDQVDTLFQNMSALQQESLRMAPLQDRILPPPSLPWPPSVVTPSPSTASMPSLPRPPSSTFNRALPSFIGPTSTAFTVDVAKNTLHNMGYTAGDGADEHGGLHEETPHQSPFLPPLVRSASSQDKAPTDPLWSFDKNEIIRLCRVYEDEVGIMYPVINIETVIDHVKSLTAWMDLARRNGGSATPLESEDRFRDLRTRLLKILMCCGLTVEHHGHSARAIELYESMAAVIDRKLMSEAADAKELPFFALVAGYRFLSSDEVLGWRIMGHVARLCMELGLHRREGLANIADEQSRRDVLHTFWTAYVLDRRWSFSTGLPYVCHDDKIDPRLPLPEEYPYLVAMISYSKLGAKIWKLIDYFEPALMRELKGKDVEDLDRQILDWYDSVPEEVKVTSLNRTSIPFPAGPFHDNQRLKIWTRLRLNQIRIWLHTPVLHSASSIAENVELAQRAVDLAKDTIIYLARLNNETNVYRRIQVFYHQFLTSAIAVLFLASTHAPLQFSESCRPEFYMALELVKDMSARSWVSQRLWRTVRSLKSYALRLGLLSAEAGDETAKPGSSRLSTFAASLSDARSPNSQSPAPLKPAPRDSSRSASRGLPPPTSSSQTPQQHQSMPEDQRNGVRLQTEIGRIFEGMSGLGPHSLSSPAAGPETQHHVPHSGAGAASDFENGGSRGGSASGSPGGEVYQHLRDMF